MHLLRTHIHLGVGDTARSAAFYEALLGAPPASRSGDTTVFESDTPPLVLTLQAHLPVRPMRGQKGPPRPLKNRRPSSPPHNRFALVVPEPELVGKAAVALWRAGASLRLQDQGIEAHDPDGNAWRVQFVPSAKARAVVALSEDKDERD